MMKIAKIAAGSLVWIDGVSHVLRIATTVMIESERLVPQPTPQIPKA